MIIKKVDIEDLKELNYEDGAELLLSNGYIQNDSAIENDSPLYDYISDTYFTLFDGETEHVVSFVKCVNKNAVPSNDDGAADFIVNEYWEEL